jgi:hypothetical protein
MASITNVKGSAQPGRWRRKMLTPKIYAILLCCRCRTDATVTSYIRFVWRWIREIVQDVFGIP